MSCSSKLQNYIAKYLKKNSENIFLKDSDFRGRGLHIKAAEKGELLHEEVPVCIMATSPQICDGCRQRLNRLRRAICSVCDCVVSCVQCAEKYFDRHQQSGECEVFKTIDLEQTRYGRSKEQFWLRFVARACLNAEKIDSWEILLGLVGPITEDMTPNNEAEMDKQEDEIVSNVVVLQTALKPYFKSVDRILPSIQQLEQVLVAVGNNAIGIHANPQQFESENDEFEKTGKKSKRQKLSCSDNQIINYTEESDNDDLIAWALYLCGAMVNHSCDPNSQWSFDATSGIMSIHFISDPTKHQSMSEEIEVSYLPEFLLKRDQSSNSGANLLSSSSSSSQPEDNEFNFEPQNEIKMKRSNIRQMNLEKHGFDFKCTCRLCLLEYG